MGLNFASPQDLVINTIVQIEESLEDIQKGSMLNTQERASYGIGLPTMDALGKVNPLHQGPMFSAVELAQPDLLPLLQDVPVELRNRIVQVAQQNHEENSA